MDREWAVGRLRAFVQDIDRLSDDKLSQDRAAARHAIEELIAVDPVMRDLMNAARPGLGSYATPQAREHIIEHGETSMSHYDKRYWSKYPKKSALMAIGVLTLGAEARARMRPDSPDLAADRLHSWVWEAAAPMWEAGSTQEAVHSAARSVNARLQQKLGRHDLADAGLCRQAFSLNDPAPGQPRLRFLGDRKSETWRSRQNGGIQLGAGCFEGIRNPAAHDDALDLPEQVALEQLAAFSVLARWIDECTVEVAESGAAGHESLP